PQYQAQGTMVQTDPTTKTQPDEQPEEYPAHERTPYPLPRNPMECGFLVSVWRLSPCITPRFSGRASSRGTMGSSACNIKRSVKGPRPDHAMGWHVQWFPVRTGWCGVQSHYTPHHQSWYPDRDVEEVPAAASSPGSPGSRSCRPAHRAQ